MSNRAIYKAHLAIQRCQTIFAAKEFKPVHVGLDPSGQPCLWYECNPDGGSRVVDVVILGTGHTLPDDYNEMHHFGSFVQGEFVWHVYLWQKR